jgi:predicted phage-related endonuclease
MPADERAAWLEKRRRFVCGTDVSRIMGASRYGGPIDVYLEKNNQAKKKKQTDVQARGHILEPALMNWYAQKSGHEVLHPEQSIIEGVTAWHGASLDGYARTADIDYVVVDAKTSRDREQWGASGSSRVPIEVEIQMRWYMPILEQYLNKIGVDGSCGRAVLPTYFPLQDEFCLFYVNRDLEVEERMVKVIDEWWERHIISGKRPQIDGSKGAAMLLESTYESDQGVPKRAATDTEATLARTLADVKDQMKSLDQQKRLIENQLKESIGPAKGIFNPTFKVSWGWQRSAARLNTSRLKAERPELVAEYTERSEKPIRVFRTTFKKLIE